MAGPENPGSLENLVRKANLASQEKWESLVFLQLTVDSREFLARPVVPESRECQVPLALLSRALWAPTQTQSKACILVQRITRSQHYHRITPPPGLETT